MDCVEFCSRLHLLLCLRNATARQLSTLVELLRELRCVPPAIQQLLQSNSCLKKKHHMVVSLLPLFLFFGTFLVSRLSGSRLSMAPQGIPRATGRHRPSSVFWVCPWGLLPLGLGWNISPGRRPGGLLTTSRFFADGQTSPCPWGKLFFST